MPDDRPSYAFVSNEPTPYRVHLLERLAHEVSGARLVSVFLNRPGSGSMSWSIDLPEPIGPVTFPGVGRQMDRGPRGREAALCRAVAQTLEREAVELVIVHGWVGPAERGTIAWARKRGVPVLVRGDSNVHSAVRGGGLKARLREWLKGVRVRWVVGQVSGLMPMGVCGRKYFEHYAPGHGKPEFLCPCEPDLSLLEHKDPAAVAEFLEAHGLDTGRKRLLYCGRLASVKRVDALIDAFARLADDFPGWDLMICGDGPLRGELEARARAAGLTEQRVHWLGFLPDPGQVRLAYHASDVLVLPSSFEPWALVISEAVAAGLAVVATDVVGAAPELIEPGVNGQIVPPGDVDALAGALEQVMRPGVAERMGQRGADVLTAWRERADPVAGVRGALAHFGVIGGGAS